MAWNLRKVEDQGRVKDLSPDLLEEVREELGGVATSTSKGDDIEFDIEGYYWCLHCERAWSVKALRVATLKRASRWLPAGEVVLACATEGCDGGLLDWMPWGALPGERPELPEEGVEYPLYEERG